MLALIGCASPPDLVGVSERDLEAALSAAAAMSPECPPSSPFTVSSFAIEPRERTVHIGLLATSVGEGWRRTDEAFCSRYGDDAAWSCQAPLVYTVLELKEVKAAVRDLRPQDAVSAVRFLLDLPPNAPELRGVAIRGIDCVVGEGDEVYVQFGSVHQSVGSYGLVVLKRSGESFEIEHIEPAPNPLIGGRASLWQCEEFGALMLPPRC